MSHDSQNITTDRKPKLLDEACDRKVIGVRQKESFREKR